MALTATQSPIQAVVSTMIADVGSLSATIAGVGNLSASIAATRSLSISLTGWSCSCCSSVWYKGENGEEMSLNEYTWQKERSPIEAGKPEGIRRPHGLQMMWEILWEIKFDFCMENQGDYVENIKGEF